MTVEPEFSTVADADAAYFGQAVEEGSQQQPAQTDPGQPGYNDPTDDSAMWGELQTVDTDWVAGWTLAFQVSTQDDERRYMVFRINPENDDFEAMSMEGNAKAYPDDVALSEIPSGSSEEEARRAYQTWLENNPVPGDDPAEEPGDDPAEGPVDGPGDGTGPGDGSEGWTEWARLEQINPWWLWGRESIDGEAAQFILASTLQDGTSVYLQPDGSLGPEPYIYDTVDGFSDALDAYFQRVADGEIPPGEQPTGNSPPAELIAEEAALAGANTGSSGGVARKAALALGAAAVGYFIIKKQGEQ